MAHASGFLCPHSCFREHAYPAAPRCLRCSRCNMGDVSDLNSGVRYCLAACSTGAVNVHTPAGKLVFGLRHSVLPAAPAVSSFVVGALPNLWPALRALRTRSLRLNSPKESFTPDLHAALKIARSGYPYVHSALRISKMDAASPDAARDRPASLGGQYEKLLATVGNLQGDLQRTVGVCQVWFTLIAKAVHCAQPTHAYRTIVEVLKQRYRIP